MYQWSQDWNRTKIFADSKNVESFHLKFEWLEKGQIFFFCYIV